MFIPGFAQACIGDTSADNNYLLVACGEMGFAIFDISDLQDGYEYLPSSRLA
ncbi:MAG: hypothetical protein MZV64_25000 [Ignavibacteriales bacterium]|nr:hypothetical protein [Ignavibacteriales bacterium]